MSVIRPIITTSLGLMGIGYFPVPWWGLLLILIALACLMQIDLFQRRLVAREFWLNTYLRPESRLREWLQRTRFLKALSFAIAIALSLVVYVYNYSFVLTDVIAIASALAVAAVTHQRLTPGIDSNIAQAFTRSTHDRVFHWFAVVLVVLFLAMATLIRGLNVDYSSATASDIADQTIAEVKHPVAWVKYAVRALIFFELESIRIRDQIGWPLGWLVYLFLLIPNAFAAYGIVSLYGGIKRLFDSGVDHEKNSPGHDRPAR